MSVTFASNRSRPLTIVYDNAMNLPAPGNGNARSFGIRFKLKAPYVYFASRGNFLLEIEIPAQAAWTDYAIDAAISEIP